MRDAAQRLSSHRDQALFDAWANLVGQIAQAYSK